MGESKATEFRRELLALLEKFQCAIDFDADESTDFYGIRGASIVAKDSDGTELMRINGYGVEACDIQHYYPEAQR